MTRTQLSMILFVASSTLLCQQREREERFAPALGAEPEASYQQILAAVGNARGQAQKPCLHQALGQAQRMCAGSVILPPFPLRFSYDADEDWGWAPLDQTELDGAGFEERVLQPLRDRAVYPSRLSGAPARWSFLAYSPVSYRANQRLVVECFVDEDDKEQDVPRLCVPFAAMENERTWLAVERQMVFRPPKIRAGGDVDVAFYILGKRLGFEDIKEACARALTGKPAGLTVERRESEVVGKSRGTPSGVLAGWREQMTARVGVKRDPTVTGRPAGDYEVTLSTTLMVGKQNSDRPEDWHAPSHDQSDAYVWALKEHLGKELMLACETDDVVRKYGFFYEIRCQ